MVRIKVIVLTEKIYLHHFIGSIHGMLQLTIVVTVLNLVPLVLIGFLPAGREEHQVSVCYDVVYSNAIMSFFL